MHPCVPVRHPRHSLRCALLLALLATLGGCAGGGADKGLGSRIDQTMQAVGLRRGDDGDAGDSAKDVRLRLHAAGNLNGGSEARPLALVVKLYRLREVNRFESAPYDAFLDEASEREALGADLIESREVLLLPGQRYDVVETLPADTRHLGIVALFRAPAATRWRFSFDAGRIDANGILIGLHSCAMTTTSEALETRLGSPAHALSGVNCPEAPR